MSDDLPFHQFPMHARAFLSRASVSLAKFESEGDVSEFFYSALHLRFGIEARLNEYIAGALQSLKRPAEATSQYVATSLLRRLKDLDSNAERSSLLQAKSPQTGEVLFQAQYTPVSRRLAAIHGQLGEFLHHKFFLNNPNWYVKASLAPGPHKSLADHVALLREGITELTCATSGTLLSTPFFTALVEEALREQDSKSPAEGNG